MAKTQEDLLKIALNSSPMKEEKLMHPLCEVGFYEYAEEGIARMSDIVFKATMLTLAKARPSAHLWDVVPDTPHTKEAVFMNSPEAFRLSFEDRAALFTEEFLRRPKMVGFRWELHGLEGTTDGASKISPSASLWIYEAEGDLSDGIEVPVIITVRYRSNF